MKRLSMFTGSESFPHRKDPIIRQHNLIFTSVGSKLGVLHARVSSATNYIHEASCSICLKQKSSLGSQVKRKWILILFTHVDAQNICWTTQWIMQSIAVNHWLKPGSRLMPGNAPPGISHVTLTSVTCCLRFLLSSPVKWHIEALNFLRLFEDSMR